MTDYRRPETVDELAQNFPQLKPLMNATMAYYESARCLFCYDAPCIKACPTGIDIPLFIRQIHTDNLTGAAQTIYESNFFGHTCGKVCPTEELCEGACVFNEQDVKPIEIGRLQSYAATKAIKSNKTLFAIPGQSSSRIAVIGAGPAGIACACELRLNGHEVDVFEAKSEPSGLALHGTAPYKITNQEVLDEVSYLEQQFGFTIHYNHAVDDQEEVDRISSNYDAVFIGIGLGNTRPIGIAGENLNHCMGATEFIESLKMAPLDTWVGQNVVVIGGGNTAMDAASETARMGARVTLVYRRDKSSMSAYDFEYELVRQAGVDAIFSAEVFEIRGKDNVEEVSCLKTRQSNGRLEQIPGSEFTLRCDMVIRATGQEKQTWLLDLAGVDYDKKGRIRTNQDGYRCGDTVFFAGGDALNGGAEVVNACAEGKAAAREMHEFIIGSK